MNDFYHYINELDCLEDELRFEIEVAEENLKDEMDRRIRKALDPDYELKEAIRRM